MASIELSGAAGSDSTSIFKKLEAQTDEIVLKALGENEDAKAHERTVVGSDSHLLDLLLEDDSYKVSKNLVWIEQNPYYRKILEVWEESLRSSKVGLERWKGSKRALVNDISQIAAFYFIFVGLLLLTGTNTPGSPTYESRIYLTIFACAASLISLWVIAVKLKHIRVLSWRINEERVYLRWQLVRISALKRRGKDYNFNQPEYRPPKEIGVLKWTYNTGAVALFLVLCQLAWVFPLAVWRITGSRSA